MIALFYKYIFGLTRHMVHVLHVYIMYDRFNTIILVLFNFSGGSACLSMPESGLTLDDKLKTIKLLVQAGADIKELNSVRKVLSAVKGGKLAVAAYPATIVGLIISDIVGDPLQDIASGPTAPDMNCGANAMDIIVKYKLETKVSLSWLFRPYKFILLIRFNGIL